MSFKIKGEEEENPTYLNLSHDASGNVWLEASNKQICVGILSVEGNGTFKLLKNRTLDLQALGFKVEAMYSMSTDRAKVLLAE